MPGPWTHRRGPRRKLPRPGRAPSLTQRPRSCRATPACARRPSSSSISGSQPSSCWARVMSGWRTCGSSTGSASKTIWLDEPVARTTASASSSSVISAGLPMLTGQVLARLGEQDQPADEVVDEAEAARLRAVAEHRQRLLLERLADEGRDRAAVVRSHARPVGVEDAHDRRVDALLAVVGHRQRLGVALGLVVDAARADRVDVAPVGLRLRMHLRVAVHLARRGEQEARPLHLGEAERVVRAVRADLERLQRQPQVVDRARRAREVVDEVDRLVDLDVLRQVVREEDEGVAAQMLDVGERARLEVVDADDAVVLRPAAPRRGESRGSRRRR